ncbi:hypothetical protein D3C76_995370 [compost metagenome]
MKKLGYVSFGLILGLTLSVASPALAQTVKSITAKINSSVSVVVNGEKVRLNAQPITYNNLNYLPVGEISRALGMKVNWSKTTNTIEISEDTSTKTQPTDTISTDSVNIQAVKVYEYESVSLAFKNWNIEESKKANIKISVQEDKILLGLYDKIYHLKPNKEYYHDKTTGKGYLEESFLKNIIPNDVIELVTPVNISINDGKITVIDK